MKQSGFSLGFLSGSSLSIVGNKGIYTGVGEECETSGFTKTGVARGLTKSRDPVAR